MSPQAKLTAARIEGPSMSKSMELMGPPTQEVRSLTAGVSKRREEKKERKDNERQ